MLKGPLALLLVGGGVHLLGSTARAQQALPLLPGVEVSPAVLTEPGDVTVRVPGFPGAQGCRFGVILAGTSISDARVLLTGDFDVRQTFVTSSFKDGPFASGSYLIFVRCTAEDSNSTDYSTDQTLTILATATTTTTTTTTTAPTSSSSSSSVTSSSTTTTTTAAATGATVDPTTAKPGETTLTLRGNGFKPDTPLQITLGTTPVTQVATTKALADGTYATTLKLPVSAPPGAQQLLVTGEGPDGVSRSTTVSVTVQDLDCSDFATSEAAQAALGTGGSDPHGLDADKDGIACEQASTGGGGGGSGGGGATATAAGGNLPQTGTDRSAVGVMAGLTAMTLGALLVGLSHPAVPARGLHRRRRTGRN